MDATPPIRKPRRSQRLRAKAREHLQAADSFEPPVDTPAAEPVDTVQNVNKTARAMHLADPTLGVETVYTGPPALILNGVSSLRTPDGGTLKLLPGTSVRVCTRPTIPFGTTEPSVRIHFSTRARGHTSDCRCGACGCAFSLTNVAPEPCSCGTEVYDEGKQQCAIM